MADAEDGLVDTQSSESETESESEASTSSSSTDGISGRSLMWLTQEDQLQLAGKRLKHLLQENNVDQLKQEIFQKDAHDGIYLMHEVMARYDQIEDSMFVQLHEFCLQYPNEYRTVLTTQPHSSQQRTPLHWAAFHLASIDMIIKPLARACPEALLLQDARNWTPAEVYKHYFLTDVFPVSTSSERRDIVVNNLELSWKHHCVRQEVHKCVVRYFVTKHLQPFSQQHRKERAGNMKARSWNTLSILGHFENRNKQLVCKILSYIGCKTKQGTKRKRR